MRRILITEFMDESAVSALRQKFVVTLAPHLHADRASLIGAVADIDGLIVRNRTRVDRALVDAAPRLRVVGRLGVGLDNIDLEACAAKSVRVFPATGANALSVAEYVICTAMLLLRGAYQSSGQMLEGTWPREALSNGRELSGRILGIVGFGLIGQRVAGLARALGMQVLGHDAALARDDGAWARSGAAFRELEPLLAESDVVTLHVPLTGQTRKLLDARRLGLMRRDAVLINTARGGVVDEAALARALREGALGAAALDVFETEPLAAGSPLAGAPNLILTPHVAGLTRESNVRVSEMIATQVAQALA